MLSRVADSIFWMARYMERTNAMLRTLRTNYIACQDEVKDFSWQTLLRNHTNVDEEQIIKIGNNSAKVLEHLLVEKNNSSSVLNSIIKARENARAVQDHITKEVWQCLNDYYHLVRQEEIKLTIRSGDPVTAMDSLIHQGMLYHGIVDVTMARGEGFTYLNIGKFLERAILSADMLNIKLVELNYDLHQKIEVPALRYLLYSLAGYELYLKTNRGNFQVEPVIRQILYSENFPHSVAYCLKQLLRYFERLETESIPDSYKQLEFLIGKTMNEVKYSSVSTDGHSLKILLAELKQELTAIASAFNKYYFGNTQ